MSLRAPGTSRPDWAPANSSGLFDALICRAINRRRPWAPSDYGTFDNETEVRRQRYEDAWRMYAAGLPAERAER